MKYNYYNVLKFFLSGIYRFWYRPTIIGKENIPKEGRCILVGNHIHVLDQSNIIISTKRQIAFMAKIEYFQGKFAWFFKKTGCIPVDRSKKDTDATTKALDVLNNNQALGLFPEGTRNRLKEEKIKELIKKYDLEENEELINALRNTATSQVQFLEDLIKDKRISKKDFLANIYNVDSYLKNLLKKKIITEEEYYDSYFLPFKYGTVSMANKTNSVIIPYIITGDYKFRTKNLLVRIGKPITPSKDLEKENVLLRQEMIKLLKENLKSSEK